MALRLDGNGVRLKNYHNKSTSLSNNLNLEITKDLYRIQLLNDKVFFLLNSYLNNYNQGRFDIFRDSLPEDIVINLTSLINNDDIIYNENVDSLRFFVHDKNIAPKYVDTANEIMDSLKQILTDRIRIDALEAQSAECSTYKEILNNKDKLVEYLEEVQKTTFLFDADVTFDQPIQLKLWYQVYLDRYGPPGDGVFNSQLLADIIEELIAAGLISEDDVIL